MATRLSYPSVAGEDASKPRRHCLVFFVTGNPGLVDYYGPFLSTLRNLVDQTESASNVSIHIYGQNLAGFDDSDHEPFTTARPPHNLEDQIQYVWKSVTSVRIEQDSSLRKGTPFDEIILVGHSVGTYIVMELFHRQLNGALVAPPGLNLKAAILLFPTIAHLAKSPRGIRLNWLTQYPFLDRNAHRAAAGFLYLFPAWSLRWIVRNVLGFPPHAADATVRLLSSRDGVWQAIHLGKDELRVIAEDRWGDEIWELGDASAADAHSGIPKFFMYFGKDDHWVVNELRDEFIEKRNEHALRDGPRHKQGSTRIVVDESGVPHDFCINHSEVVAEKVKMWLDEIFIRS